ncbi:MAG: transposase [Magnetococcales bacterium]|nr:transposase [Magnetococcales bacterium]
MAKNSVQFQKGLSLASFLDQCGTEEQCREAVYKMRWPRSYQCPECGGEKYSEIKTRKLFQCSRCRHQTSLTAGTIFQGTKLSLRKWFLAMYFLTQGKSGISSIALSRHTGVSQNTAWRVKHKLMQVMLEREEKKQLSGRIEVDGQLQRCILDLFGHFKRVVLEILQQYFGSVKVGTHPLGISQPAQSPAKHQTIKT